MYYSTVVRGSGRRRSTGLSGLSGPVGPIVIDGQTYTAINQALAMALNSGKPVSVNGQTVQVVQLPNNGGFLLNGCPLNVVLGQGWLPGQQDALRQQNITTCLPLAAPPVPTGSGPVCGAPDGNIIPCSDLASYSASLRQQNQGGSTITVTGRPVVEAPVPVVQNVIPGSYVDTSGSNPSGPAVISPDFGAYLPYIAGGLALLLIMRRK
jgi:hypothetical protein